jgi:hypothetical protein
VWIPFAVTIPSSANSLINNGRVGCARRRPPHIGMRRTSTSTALFDAEEPLLYSLGGLTRSSFGLIYYVQLLVLRYFAASFCEKSFDPQPATAPETRPCWTFLLAEDIYLDGYNREIGYLKWWLWSFQVWETGWWGIEGAQERSFWFGNYTRTEILWWLEWGRGVNANPKRQFWKIFWQAQRDLKPWNLMVLRFHGDEIDVLWVATCRGPWLMEITLVIWDGKRKFFA